MQTIPQDKPACPACGNVIFSKNQPNCPRCNWQLLDDEIFLGWSNEAYKAFQDRLDVHRREYFWAIMRVVYQAGTKDPETYSKLTEDLARNQDRENPNAWMTQLIGEYEWIYDAFIAQAKENHIADEYVADLVKGKSKRIVLCDCSPSALNVIILETDHISRVNSIQDASWLWKDIVPSLPEDDLERQLILASNLPDTLSEGISSAVEKVATHFKMTLAEKILVCSRLCDWQHHIKFHDALRDAGFSAERVYYDPHSFVDIKEYSKNLIKRAPLGCSLYLLIAEVNSKKGTVKAPQTYILTEEDGKKYVRTTKKLIIKSYNHIDGILWIVIVAGEEKVFIKSWELSLGHSEQASLQLSPSSTDAYSYDLSVSGCTAREVKIDLDRTLKNIPDKISLVAPLWHVTILIDTIGNEAIVRERCQYVRDFLILCSELPALSNALVSIIAYGDHDHRFLNRRRPQVTSWREKKSVRDILPFLNEIQLNPTPFEEVDFEAGLEEALDRVVQLHREPNEHAILITVGHRPPHPKVKLPNEIQLPSPAGLDWQNQVEELQHQGVKSYVVMCEPIGHQPSYAPIYLQDFWPKLGYNLCTEMSKISGKDLLSIVFSKETAGKVPLRLPVIINKSH